MEYFSLIVSCIALVFAVAGLAMAMDSTGHLYLLNPAYWLYQVPRQNYWRLRHHLKPVVTHEDVLRILYETNARFTPDQIADRVADYRGWKKYQRSHKHTDQIECILIEHKGNGIVLYSGEAWELSELGRKMCGKGAPFAR